jgi:hypothetical protein
MITSENDATMQLSFWIVDGTPDFEDNSKPYENSDHYTIFTKHLLQTAVKLRPNVALQMAMNILQNLANLPESIRTAYQLPKGIELKHGDF